MSIIKLQMIVLRTLLNIETAESGRTGLLLSATVTVGNVIVFKCLLSGQRFEDFKLAFPLCCFECEKGGRPGGANTTIVPPPSSIVYYKALSVPK